MSTRESNPGRSVSDCQIECLTRLCQGSAVELQKVLHVEGVKRPEDLIVRLVFELTAADGGELVVHQDPPELRRRLRIRTDPGDEEVVKGAKGAVKSEAGQLPRRVQGGRRGVSRRWVGPIVCAIATMRPAGGGGDVVTFGEDNALEDGRLGAFDA